jgi:demethylmenaquinone methyltransferase/2-methoxy-6-polyprenyl-1,4-benzoquinol methylase
MLVLGNEKVRKANAGERVTLIEGDTQRLPAPSNTFGVVCVAFGLRNIHDTVRGLDEMVRVARPGGKVAILEFSRPTGAILGRIYLTFFRHVLPRIGQALSPNQASAYDYLPKSVLAFPDGQAMLDLMESRGLTSLEQYPLTGGIATLYVGVKPAPSELPPAATSRPAR